MLLLHLHSTRAETRALVDAERGLQPEGRHPPRGVAASGLRPLRNIPHCCLPQESGPCLSPSVAGRPLRPATRRRLGRPSPHQQADRPRAHPRPDDVYKTPPFRPPPCDRSRYPVLAPVSRSYPRVWGRSPTCYSPVRHSPRQPKPPGSVRLACVKHAASVRPEPGSNSPKKNLALTRPIRPDGGRDNKPAIPQKQMASQTYRHTVEFSKNRHTHRNPQDPHKMTTSDLT